jgi:hypothetical protein
MRGKMRERERGREEMEDQRKTGEGRRGDSWNGGDI